MSETDNFNSLNRFRRLPVRDEWPQCFICRENVTTGLTLYEKDFGGLLVVTVCDGCIEKAKKSQTGWIREGSV